MAKQEKGKDPEFKPQGTIAIMIIFVITLIMLWGYVYFILISRGVTV